MWPISIALAFLHFIGVATAAVLMLFVALSPGENATANDLADDDWLAPAAVALLALAVGFLLTVIAQRAAASIGLLALEILFGLAVLGFVLSEWTDNEARLLAFAVAVLLPGVTSVIVSSRSGSPHLRGSDS